MGCNIKSPILPSLNWIGITILRAIKKSQQLDCLTQKNGYFGGYTGTTTIDRKLQSAFLSKYIL